MSGMHTATNGSMFLQGMSYITSVVRQLELIIHQLPEYLWTHWKKWVENSNEKQTVMINNNAYRELNQYFSLP
jgi:hypothetical protein